MVTVLRVYTLYLTTSKLILNSFLSKTYKNNINENSIGNYKRDDRIHIVSNEVDIIIGYGKFIQIDE